MSADIEAHDVGELHRSHGHAVAQRGFVDDFDRNAVLQREHRFVQIRHQHAIDEKAGRALAGQRKLVDLARERDGLLDRLFAAGFAAHDLHQRHLRHRVEEVQADQLAGIGQVVVELLEHDR